MEALFQFPLIVFFAPVLLSLTLWALAALGLISHEHGDLDAEAPVDTGADAALHGNIMEYLGLGMVPLQVFITLLLFLFGWLGIGLHYLVPVIGLWVSLPASAILALLCTALLSRRLRPLFQSYGRATRKDEIVGRIGLLSSSEFTPEFGLARVKLDDGNWVEIPVRAEDTTIDPVITGAQMVITRYDESSGVYYATPFED